MSDTEEAGGGVEGLGDASRSYVGLVVAVLLVLATTVGYFVLRGKSSVATGGTAETKGEKDGDGETEDETVAKGPVDPSTIGLGDVAYIMKQLSPSSTHMDVLWTIASTPESIRYGLNAYENVVKLQRQRKVDDDERKKNLERAAKEQAAVSFELDDEGWDDDDDGEENDKDEDTKRKEILAAQADEKKKKEREQLEKATGKAQIKLEGFDEGVIGQQWVETTLEKNGAWPPEDLGPLNDKTFNYQGNQVTPLEHPGLRRNICMVTGRLNSTMLNSHPELLEAGSKQLVDQTYFKASMEFRSRCGLLLEAALRSAVACRSYDLANTIVEAVAMFKIGCEHGKTEWFEGVMQKTYQCLPRLEVKEPVLANADGEPEIIPGDLVCISLQLTRLHAESFTRQKIAMYQKQGIPPQVALQAYRESWWFLVRAARIDGGEMDEEYKINTNGILQRVKSDHIDKFRGLSPSQKLITAWPMVVQNVAQKTGKLKVQFLSPSKPGKYRFDVLVKSQDFLGADQAFVVEGEVLDPSTVERKPKEEKDEENEKKAKEERTDDRGNLG